jgi:hypothetical protein
MLVSYKTAQPQKLPIEHTGKSEQELSVLEFVICPVKPSYIPGQKLWWENNQWTIQDPNESELEIQWQKIKTEAQKRLSDSDYKIIKLYELKADVPVVLFNYRQALRDIYNNINVINPFSPNWPQLLVEQS